MQLRISKPSLLLICLSLIYIFFLYLFDTRNALETMLSKGDFFETPRKYIVSNNKCKIPDLHPWNSVARSTYVNKTRVSCGYQEIFIRIEKDDGRIYLKVDESKKWKYSSYTCTVCIITRIRSAKPETDFDDSECYKFTDLIEVNASMFQVYCETVNKHLIFTDIYGIFRAADMKKKLMAVDVINKPYNVLIVGIDSVSRLNFIRLLTKTYKHLTYKKWIEFKAYNKVGLNTFPNLMAFLTGISIAKLKDLRGMNLDDQDFVWKDFSSLGYITAFAEDSSHINTFNLNRNGFSKEPTDYYFRPYVLAYEYLVTERVDTMLYCAGYVTIAERILRLASDYSSTFYNHPYFGMFWMNSFSHDDLNTPGRMDEIFLIFLKELEDSNVMDDTIIIFLADHGIRTNNIRKSLTGWYEDRLPFLFLWLPDKFQKNHLEEYQNALSNSQKLTSAYDLYLTFQNILELANSSYHPKTSTECPTCRSFFKKMPTARSCEEAGIGVEWCTCIGYSMLHNEGFLAKASAKFSLAHTIKVIYSFSSRERCAALVLGKIQHARISDRHGEWSINSTYVTVVFETQPLTVLEATLKLVIKDNNPVFEMVGNASRIDSYEQTGKCVEEYVLKMFCYCKSY